LTGPSLNLAGCSLRETEMPSAILLELEQKIRKLSAPDQWWLIERTLESMREKAEEVRQQAELAAMAADPNVQREIRQIQKEFAVTEADGLEDL
jgi:hypothetical protein